MAGWSDMGYRAPNELDPSVWKEYMLADLERQNVNFMKRLMVEQRRRRREKKDRQRKAILGALTTGVGILTGNPWAALLGLKDTTAETAEFGSPYEYMEENRA